MSPETAAKVLEATDDYRVLRRLRPRAVDGPRPPPGGEKLVVIVDTETTGLDHRHHEVIELGMVGFVHDGQGGIVSIMCEFSALQESSGPLAPEIVRLTGLTDEMLAGERIDVDAVEAFIEHADLIVAHNAGFDRPFCERLGPRLRPQGLGLLRQGGSLSGVRLRGHEARLPCRPVGMVPHRAQRDGVIMHFA